MLSFFILVGSVFFVSSILFEKTLLLTSLQPAVLNSALYTLSRALHAIFSEMGH